MLPPLGQLPSNAIDSLRWYKHKTVFFFVFFLGGGGCQSRYDVQCIIPGLHDGNDTVSMWVCTNIMQPSENSHTQYDSPISIQANIDIMQYREIHGCNSHVQYDRAVTIQATYAVVLRVGLATLELLSL